MIDMNQSKATYLWLLLLFSYCALIYCLSDQSHLPVPYVFDMQDKLIHATAYAIMAFIFWQSWRERLPIFLLAVLAVVFCSLFGVTDEWHQSFVPGRDASVFDWLADTTGAFVLTMVLYKREFVR
ncbi:MAG: VanZ family protein [Mariprofundus sp.]|nr:VanZ family protein [Mariprofundus sp.]